MYEVLLFSKQQSQINVGREVLAQLSTPAALNFSDATERVRLNRNELESTGNLYIELLHDLDSLVGLSDAFKLSPWISSARNLASQTSSGAFQQDCFSPILANRTNGKDGCCKTFFEWNARCQITTWYDVLFCRVDLSIVKDRSLVDIILVDSQEPNTRRCSNDS